MATATYYPVGGTLSGLTAGRLRLEIDPTIHLNLSSNGHFNFPKALPAGTDWSVRIMQQPQGFQWCDIVRASGRLESPIADVGVTCRPAVAGVSTVASTAGRLAYPNAVAVDAAGNLYVADTYHNVIRKISADGSIRTLAGAEDISGASDGTGITAFFNSPEGIAVDRQGTVYVSDTGNGAIRRITPDGTVTTMAGNATAIGYRDGLGRAASFNVPRGIAVDALGIVYVADAGNHVIRKIGRSGLVTTLAGNPALAGSEDGAGDRATFDYPDGVAVDSRGTVYVADANTSTIRRISAAGDVTTLAGNAHDSGYRDGSGPLARFNQPEGLAIDDDGNLYIADTFNRVIRKLTAAGEVTTLAGAVGRATALDGAGSAAAFRYPAGIAARGGHELYVADMNDHSIRRIVATHP